MTVRDLHNLSNFDAVTPQQLADELYRSRHRSPEQRMCIAHLTDAFAEAIDMKFIYRARRQQAIDWIAGKLHGQISFDLCCEALALEPQWLRERLLRRMRDNNVQKLFKRRRRTAEGKTTDD